MEITNKDKVYIAAGLVAKFNSYSRLVEQEVMNRVPGRARDSFNNAKAVIDDAKNYMKKGKRFVDKETIRIMERQKSRLVEILKNIGYYENDSGE